MSLNIGVFEDCFGLEVLLLRLLLEQSNGQTV
jgi:hypothetical protein